MYYIYIIFQGMERNEINACLMYYTSFNQHINSEIDLS